MFVVEENSISLVQGDTGLLSVKLDDHFLEEGDKTHFLVANANTKEVVIKKCLTDYSNGIGIVALEALDTLNLDAGSYVYDIKVETRDSRISTIISHASFTIVGGIKHDC